MLESDSFEKLPGRRVVEALSLPKEELPSDNLSLGYDDPSQHPSGQPSELTARQRAAYEYPESSIQNMTHYREMIIEDSMDTITEMDILQSPHL